jgi:cysteinyl-tRNA synthetase
MALNLYNTKSDAIEPIIAYHQPIIGMYTCGMTVYDYAHIGHGRKYTMDDILRRTLELDGFKVNHVQNVTDVGHLSSDADAGEDKLEKGAKKYGKTVWEVAEYFTDDFYKSMDMLGILRPTTIAKATDHISEQIELVQRLIDKYIAYDTPEAVYFDIAKFPAYGELSGQKLAEKLVAVRDEVETGSYKKHPHDFALWFKRVGHFSDHAMHWPSPWGDGFPGWHIECSAMSMKYLGETFEIHTGGIDHIPVHHENEIAQSEAATGKPFARYWVHYNFLTVNGEKMSKSLGNWVRIQDVADKGFDPLALRYLYLGAHYRSALNFTWESLEAAQQTLLRIRSFYAINFTKDPNMLAFSEEESELLANYREKFKTYLGDDLSTAKVLALIHELIRDKSLVNTLKPTLLKEFDEVLGIGIDKEVAVQKIIVPDEVKILLEKRILARTDKNWKLSDDIRDEIARLGYEVKDTPTGQTVEKL